MEKRIDEYKIIDNVLEKNKPKRNYVKNALKAFIVGGVVSLIAQGFLLIFVKIFSFDDSTSKSLMSVTMVVIASILTGFGIFDKIGQFSGAGTYIPITGFANSMTSSALESKSEGLVLGIMTNMFKLAGAVIVAGIVSASLSALIIYLVEIIG